MISCATIACSEPASAPRELMTAGSTLSCAQERNAAIVKGVTESNSFTAIEGYVPAESAPNNPVEVRQPVSISRDLRAISRDLVSAESAPLNPVEVRQPVSIPRSLGFSSLCLLAAVSACLH